MVSAVVLAAGEGKRMKSELPKVLHKLGKRALVEYVLDAIAGMCDEIVVVVGHKAELVKEYLSKTFPDVKFALQERQLGTADAVKSALREIKGEVVVVVPGDMPLLRKESMKALVAAVQQGADAAVLVCEVEDPTGYGRVVLEGEKVVKIVEEADATSKEKEIRIINTGAYCFKKEVLEEFLPKIGCENAKGEYYLTDIVELLCTSGKEVKAIFGSSEEGTGVNSRRQLARAYDILSNRKAQELLDNGVTIFRPETVFISPEVVVGKDTVIHPFVFITGKSVIGSGCTIEPFCVIEDCILGDNVEIHAHSVLKGAVVKDGTSVGPFARLREGTVLEKGSRIGNFVEVKKSVIGEGSKANHLAYIGDATVGKNVNIGAGTITCNYDGVKKHPTVIEDGVFIGSDTQLVAPVRIGKGSLVGAGSTITKDIPPDSLAITRAPLKVFEGKGVRYFKKKKYGIEE